MSNNLHYTKQFIDYLSQFVSPNKMLVFDKVLGQRTYYFNVVLENIYQPHNASAVLRSCDCFGVQNLYVIENENKYNINPKVAMGAGKWVDIHKFNKYKNNTSDAIQNLKSKGFRIVATTPSANAISLSDFDVEKGKFSLFFGQEKEGLSNIVTENADEFLYIPMYGFTESYNISVSAALCLYEIRKKLSHSSTDWKLTEEEYFTLKMDWIKKCVNKPHMLEEKFKESLRR